VGRIRDGSACPSINRMIASRHRRHHRLPLLAHLGDNGASWANGWKVVLPSARLTLVQILIGVIDLGFCATNVF